MDPNQNIEPSLPVGDDRQSGGAFKITSGKIIGFIATAIFGFLAYMLPSYATLFIMFGVIMVILTFALESKMSKGMGIDSTPLPVDGIIAGGSGGDGQPHIIRSIFKGIFLLAAIAGIFVFLLFGSCMLMMVRV